MADLTEGLGKQLAQHIPFTGTEIAVELEHYDCETSPIKNTGHPNTFFIQDWERGQRNPIIDLNNRSASEIALPIDPDEPTTTANRSPFF